MKTCFIVHNPEVAKAMRECVGPNHVVITPGTILGGFAIDRLVIVDEPSVCVGHNAYLYEEWLSAIVHTRMTRDAELVNVLGQ